MHSQKNWDGNDTMKTERRTQYEIYWEILVFCRSPRSFTAIVHRCDLNSKAGQEYIGFLCSKGYLSRTDEDEKTLYVATGRASEYITLFSELYQKLFDTIPGFKL
jgi:predicted transcriptional regulator